ncbi:hypothetical protein [Euzebyella saccharophila]|uniref:Uncharacterized protein n=1 Tax=Euzebyella saccharophila TaxID=679664 RepID=A0ABV8JRH7_9FLAO|nr:hypothetical protein [Euzebyella saccharophila]
MMKKIMFSKITYRAAIMAFSLFAASCSSDDGNVFDTPDIPQQENPDGEPNEEEEVATLVFNEGDPSNDIVVAEASGEVGTEVPGRVIFTSTDLTQRRMYITQNIGGSGDMPFNNFDLDSDDLKKATKADGSIDLDGATKKEIDFTFSLPVPDIDNGEIVYSFWTTTGKGDFRDPTKRKALGVGTITVTVGNGNNPDAEVMSFTDVQLFAPAQDGTTESFFSFLEQPDTEDDHIYRINEGPEFRAYWDFGYYYGASGVSADDKATLASASTFNESFGFFVDGLEPDDSEDDAENEELNEMFFQLSVKTGADFDAITMASELDSIEKTDFQKFTNINAGDVIEFVDNYGKKGLIKVTAIEPGFDNNDYIMFDVKIQP